MARRLLLVVMIDALGHRIVTEQGRFAFLEAPDGPVRAVCGYSSACIPSLLSGRLPREHGHWAMYLRDPAHSFARPYRVLIRLVAGLLGPSHRPALEAIGADLNRDEWGRAGLQTIKALLPYGAGSAYDVFYYNMAFDTPAY